MKGEIGKMFSWFKDVSYGVEVAETRQGYPYLTDVRQWRIEDTCTCSAWGVMEIRCCSLMHCDELKLSSTLCLSVRSTSLQCFPH